MEFKFTDSGHVVYILTSTVGTGVLWLTTDNVSPAGAAAQAVLRTRLDDLAVPLHTARHTGRLSASLQQCSYNVSWQIFFSGSPPYKSNSFCTEKNNNFFPIRWAQNLWMLKNTISWKEHKIAFLICWNQMFSFFRQAICSTEVVYFKSFRESFLYIIVSENFFSRSEEKKYPHYSELFNSTFLWLHNILLVYIPVHVRINITLPSAYVVTTPCSSHLLVSHHFLPFRTPQH